MARIYLDHAATTPLDPDVFEAMRPYFGERFGNPASIHRFGSETRQALDEARDTIARILGADRSEIVFTSGGTESDNAAILGAAWAFQERGNHIITTSIEHHAVLAPCRYLEQLGFQITYLPVDRYGQVDPEDVRRAITSRTILISIAHANNEIGTLQPIAQIAGIAREHGIPLHTDAVQTVGILPVDVLKMGVDLLSASAHKFYGPKGAGILYVRKGVDLIPLLHGGPQERDRRAGTENVPAIVGMAKALEKAVTNRELAETYIHALRERLWEGIQQRIEGVHLHGHPLDRLPSHLNIRFDGVDGEMLLMGLDLEGIAASSGSACASGSFKPSHVLLGIGLSEDQAKGSLRLTPGRENTKAEIETALDIIEQVVGRLRAFSG